MIAEFQLSEAKLSRLRLAERLAERLTPAERRIVRLSIKGLTARQIAGHIGSSPHTIETHIKSIRAKAADVYESYVCFKGFIVSELNCYYFIQEETD